MRDQHGGRHRRIYLADSGSADNDGAAVERASAKHDSLNGRLANVAKALLDRSDFLWDAEHPDNRLRKRACAVKQKGKGERERGTNGRRRHSAGRGSRHSPAV